MRHRWISVALAVIGSAGWAAPIHAQATAGSFVVSPWAIEDAQYSGEVVGQIARLEARYTVRAIQDGWVEIPLAIQGAVITALEVEKKAGEAHVVPRGETYVLAVSKKGLYKVRVTFARMLAQDSQYEGIDLTIPQATFSTLTLLVPRKDVELRPADQLYVERKLESQRDGVVLVARLGAARQIALRWRTKPAAPIKVEPVLYGEVHSLVTIDEQVAHLSAILQYRVAQGETKALQVQLPAGLNILNVSGAGIEDWHVAEGPGPRLLTVGLNFSVKDAAYQLVIEGEQSLEEKQAAYTLPELQLVGVKQERGFFAVSRSGSVEIAPDAIEGINRVDVRELPETIRQAMGSPTALAFKYHQHPYRATLTLTRHDDHPVLAAIAERGELVTIVSRQGELLTRATYLIKANKKQFLEAMLPPGAQLWSCLVGSKSVKPVEGADRKLLIPLDGTAEMADAIPVEIVYFDRRPALTRIGHLKLQGPILDVPTTVSNWSVFAPHEVKLLRFSGNLDRGAVPYAFVEEPVMEIATITGMGNGALASARSFVGRHEGSESNTRTFRLAKMAFARSGGDEKGQLESDESDRLGAGSKPNEQRQAAYYNGSNTVGGTAGERGDYREEQGKGDDAFKDAIAGLAGRLQESGILPLKIRLPRSGDVYRFNRLITTNEALELDAMFVHLPVPWMPFAAFGMLLIPLGSIAALRIRRN